MNMIDYDGLKGLLASPDLDLSELDSLSDSERQLLLQMANEFSIRGSSNTLKSLWGEDYDEVPVDIDTFLDDPHYFGEVLDGSIYPYWRNMLRELFAPDSKYFEVIFSCLTRDNLIPCLDGETRTIGEIVNLVNDGETVRVYSFDRDKHEFVVGEVTDGIMNGYRTTFEIVLDNNEVVKLTGDHKVLMKDNTWKEAKDLKVGDCLMPFDMTLKASEGRKVVKTNYNAMLLPVYDIEVLTCHNFALSAGCVVRNCSIGVGKSTIAGVAMAYKLHQLLCMKNPQKYYGLNKSSIMTLNFFNINLQLAETVSFGKFQSLITKSPWFLEHGTLVGKGKPNLVPNKGIKLMFGSNTSHALGHDVFCLTGDAKIITVQGMKTLEELENETVQVLQYDAVNNEVVLSNPCTVIKTKEVTELIRIETEDGTILRCTPEHKIRLKDGTYKQAQDLTEDDELLFFEYEEDDHGL